MTTQPNNKGATMDITHALTATLASTVPSSGAWWPTDITGFVAKIIMHGLYDIGSFINSSWDWLWAQLRNEFEGTVSDIVTATGVFNTVQQQQFIADATNAGIVANYMSGCLCNPTVFWEGLSSIVTCAATSCMIRGALKIWAVVWSGQ